MKKRRVEVRESDLIFSRCRVFEDSSLGLAVETQNQLHHENRFDKYM